MHRNCHRRNGGYSTRRSRTTDPLIECLGFIFTSDGGKQMISVTHTCELKVRVHSGLVIVCVFVCVCVCVRVSLW